MSEPNEAGRISCIACSVFRKELEALKRKGIFEFRTEYLDAACRHSARKNEKNLRNLIRSERAKGRRVILLCGCCMREEDYVGEEPGVCQVKGVNCFEVFLGRERYRKLLSEGARFLLPEWLLRWDLLMQVISPNESQPACEKTDCPPVNPGKIVYLHTGVIPIPVEHICQITLTSSLPLEILDVSLDNLYRSVNDAVKQVSPAGSGR